MSPAAVTWAALTAGAAIAPPADWSALPEFPLPRAAVIADGTGFVRREVEAARCPARPGAPADARLVVPVVILVSDDGQVRRITPRAIGCPNVEQYTVGYLESLTRSGPGSVVAPTPGWYRLTVTYRW